MIVKREYIPRHTLVFAEGGLPELMPWLESTKALHSNGKSEASDSFNGYTTWDDVLTMVRDGWSEGAAKLAAMQTTPVSFPMERKLPHWTIDVGGELPDVGRYLAGDPRHMKRRKKEKGHKPYVVLYVGMGVRASVSTKEFENFGTAFCQIIDALEHSGTRVELNQLTRAFIGSEFLVTGWRVKEADQHVDMAALAFTYMHPAAHRRLQFQMRARVSRSVGGSTDLKAEHFPDAPADAIIFAGISEHGSSCSTLKDARSFLRKRINIAAGEELVTEEMLSNLD